MSFSIDRYSLLPFDSFGLMVTFRCDCICQFCAYNAGQQWKGFMSLDRASTLIEGVKEMWKNEGIDGSLPNAIWYERRSYNKRAGIHITGGEPFLDFEKTLQIVKTIVKNSLHLQFIQTNAYWLQTEKIARERFHRLKEAGAKSIYFSRTPFHAEFVPNSNIRIGIRIGEEVFGKGNVYVREMKMLDLLARVEAEDKTVPLYRFIEYYGIKEFKRIMIEDYGITMHGRAAKTVAFIFPVIPLELLAKEDCNAEILKSRHAHITPEGEYIPFSCAGLSLGKIDRDVIGFIKNFDINRFRFIKAICSQNGIGKILKIGKDYGFIPDYTGYVKKCTLCLAIREHLFHVVKGNFPELGPEKFYTVRDTWRDPRVEEALKN